MATCVYFSLGNMMINLACWGVFAYTWVKRQVVFPANHMPYPGSADGQGRSMTWERLNDSTNDGKPLLEHGLG